jgi:hypothetical protein
VEDAAQEEGDLGSMRAHVRVRFVEHDPLELPLGAIKDRAVFLSDQHVFEHSAVRDQDWRRRVSQKLA